ncbi:MAG: hypothetical protein ACREEM_04615 [Blastocatellia bacterium]
MKNSQTFSKASSAQDGRNSNALAILKLEDLASDLSANADNPAYVRAKAEELRQIAEQAFDVLAFIGSNFSEFETQTAETA